MDATIVTSIIIKCTASLSPLQLTLAAATLILAALDLYLRVKVKPKAKQVYLVDFSCYKPPDSLRVPESHFLEQCHLNNFLNQENIDFKEKLLLRSGISSQACMPVSVHEMPVSTSLSTTILEIRQVLLSVTRDLLSKTGTNPSSVDLIVTNCSIACPTPSISSMIVGELGFRRDVRSYSLGGMGCSAGLLAVSLAADLIKARPDSTALVLSMESVSRSGYQGNSEKSMMIGNVLFRMGGAGVLLSNRDRDSGRAKYELSHLVRTHMGFDDEAYESVFQREDDDGKTGVSISKSLLRVASKALMANVSELGPKVLPYSEQLRYAISVAAARVFSSKNEKDPSPAIYVPDFKKAFEHFCIHAGGRAVIDGLEKSLGLGRDDTEASRMTLHRFGNTSSSSVWYELCYLEAKAKIRTGDRVWQIAFGSGFKCNSAVWKRLNHHADDDAREVNAWSDRIHLYPVTC